MNNQATPNQHHSAVKYFALGAALLASAGCSLGGSNQPKVKETEQCSRLVRGSHINDTTRQYGNQHCPENRTREPSSDIWSNGSAYLDSILGDQIASLSLDNGPTIVAYLPREYQG